MITKLFKFLLIQMTVQYPLAANLEGRTAHYVNLLVSYTNDDSALRISCPVYTIRPAGTDVTFTKYAASAAQYDVINNWEDITTATTFQACANQAATDGAKMFWFDDGACKISTTLFTRFPETCEDDNAVVVYMVENSKNGCADNYIWLDEGPQDGQRPFCGSAGASLNCVNGKLYGFDSDGTAAYLKAELGCYTIHSSTANVGYDFHQQDCTAKGKSSCVAPDLDSRAEFVQTMKGFAINADPSFYFDAFVVDARYEDASTMFKWFNGIPQPDNIPGEWMDGFPALQQTQGFVYMSKEGLLNDIDSLSRHYCCFGKG